MSDERRAALERIEESLESIKATVQQEQFGHWMILGTMIAVLLVFALVALHDVSTRGGVSFTSTSRHDRKA